jgi:hypothetical protein
MPTQIPYYGAMALLATGVRQKLLSHTVAPPTFMASLPLDSNQSLAHEIAPGGA